ncbi:hypothetical protein ACSE3M_01945 [Bacillus velezensis]
MLKAIGAETIDELFADIPEDVRFQKDYQIKKAKAETELTRELTKLAAKNKDAVTYASFLGAGVYDHYQLGYRRSCDFPIRVLHGLYALPA